jgi:hypothetical protein
MKRFAIVLLFSLVSHSILACLNYYHVNEEGKSSEDHMYCFDFRQRAFDKKGLVISHRLYTRLLKDKVFFENYSDYGANLLKAGYYEEGLQVFRSLITKRPDAYNIIANLATAYELNGMNDSALYFLKKGLAINKRAHGGSEWIHQHILEAKLREAIEPGWLKQHYVVPDSLMQTDSVALIACAFHAQLIERLPFTPVKDMLMARVLEQLGDYMLKNASVSEAWKLYTGAAVYATDTIPGLNDKISKARSLTLKYAQQANNKSVARYWANDKKIKTLTADLQQYKMTKVVAITPALY